MTSRNWPIQIHQNSSANGPYRLDVLSPQKQVVKTSQNKTVNLMRAWPPRSSTRIIWVKMEAWLWNLWVWRLWWSKMRGGSRQGRRCLPLLIYPRILQRWGSFQMPSCMKRKKGWWTIRPQSKTLQCNSSLILHRQRTWSLLEASWISLLMVKIALISIITMRPSCLRRISATPRNHPNSK